MTERKQTPDILAEILGGAAPDGESVPTKVIQPSVKRVKQPSVKTPKPAEAAIAGAKAATPPLWEHRVASFQEHKARGWRLRYVDGVEMENWKSGPLLNDYIREAAEEGWQIAAAASGQALFGMSDKYQLFFKRRLKNG